MARVFLIHWRAGELAERVDRLQRAGHAVAASAESGDLVAAQLRHGELPEVVVIDLGRLPSHGASMAAWLRENARTRGIPIVFVDGNAAAVAGVQRRFPGAVCTPWGRVRGALARALKSGRHGEPADRAAAKSASTRSARQGDAPQRAATKAAAKKAVATKVAATKAGAPKAVATKAAAPATAGYSGTPLPNKLGIKPGAVVALLGAPVDFARTLGPLPDGTMLRDDARGRCDVLLLFSRSVAELKKRLPAAVRALPPGGGLWITWPKKASGVATDLSEPVVRQLGLATGLVDNKVCAVDHTWSGLRFVHRTKSAPPRQ